MYKYEQFVDTPLTHAGLVFHAGVLGIRLLDASINFYSSGTSVARKDC